MSHCGLVWASERFKYVVRVGKLPGSSIYVFDTFALCVRISLGSAMVGKNFPLLLADEIWMRFANGIRLKCVSRWLLHSTAFSKTFAGIEIFSHLIEQLMDYLLSLSLSFCSRVLCHFDSTVIRSIRWIRYLSPWHMYLRFNIFADKKFSRRHST